MEKKENICRLCLKFEDTAFYPLDESSREKLEVVIPDMDLDIPSNFEICSSCTESLDSAYDFKENVQENEKVILDKIEGLGDEKLDLKDVLGAATANGDDGDGKKDVCRTCLKTCTAEDNPTSVGEEEPDSLVNTMLNVCLSNVDLQITINPVLCESCVSTLREIYGFVSRALAVDKKITAHRASNGAVDMNTILKEEKSNFFSEFEIQDEDNGPDNYDDLKILDENDKNRKRRLTEAVTDGEPPEKKQTTQNSHPAFDEDGIPHFVFQNKVLFEPNMNDTGIETWLAKVEEVKRQKGWTDGQAINKVLAKLKDMQELHNWFSNISYIMNWEDWKTKLTDAFPKNDFYLSARKMVNKRKRIFETYVDYYNVKLQLLEPLNFTDEQKVSCLIGGIHDVLISTGARVGKYQRPEELLAYFKTCDDKAPPPPKDVVKANNTKNSKSPQTPKAKAADKTPSKTFCTYCKKSGHLIKKCFQLKSDKQGKPQPTGKPAAAPKTPTANSAKKRPRCNFCGAFGHLQATCRHLNGNKPPSFRAAGKSSFQSPQMARSDRGSKCFKCYQTGHNTQECPELLMNRRFGRRSFNDFY